MKYLIGLLILLSGKVYADATNTGAIVSFSQLSNYESGVVKKGLSIRGFLFFDEGKFLFCSTMESCFSRGKERVIIKASNEMTDYLMEVSDCHMELLGEYHALDDDQSNWPILGYLYVNQKPEFDFSSKYRLINKDCKVFRFMIGD